MSIRRSGRSAAEMIGDFFVEGSPTSATQMRALSSHASCALHPELDVVGDGGAADAERGGGEPAGVRAHLLALDEGEVLDHLRQQALGQLRRREHAPEVDRL